MLIKKKCPITSNTIFNAGKLAQFFHFIITFVTDLSHYRTYKCQSETVSTPTVYTIYLFQQVCYMSEYKILCVPYTLLN